MDSVASVDTRAQRIAEIEAAMAALDAEEHVLVLERDIIFDAFESLGNAKNGIGFLNGEQADAVEKRVCKVVNPTNLSGMFCLRELEDTNICAAIEICYNALQWRAKRLNQIQWDWQALFNEKNSL